MAEPTPVLWQFQRSFFSEKGRWALDYKGIAHRRRNPVPSLHRITMRVRGLGTSVPALQVGDRKLAGSAAIVAEAERLAPEPALYPPDEPDRAEALRLEAYFDASGHEARRVALAPMLNDRERRWSSCARRVRTSPSPPSCFRWRGARPACSGASIRRAATPAREERAHQAVTEAFELIEERTGRTGYLVGEAFSVADLTAAALLGHLLAPPEAPYTWASQLFRSVRAPWAARAGGEWVLEMYRRHRGTSCAVA